MESHSMIKNSIVLVPFPFDDLSSSKLRPALCLTNETGVFKHIIVAFISSKIHENILKSDIVILKGSDLWQGTGLISDSVVRLHKMVTIPKSLIARKLGGINTEVEHLVHQKLEELFF